MDFRDDYKGDWSNKVEGMDNTNKGSEMMQDSTHPPGSIAGELVNLTTINAT